MELIIKIAQFVLSLSILIVLHELGHFTPAKWFGVRVEKFFLFFDAGFSFFKKKIGETVYGIGWLPLGGYVKLSGMIDESMDKEQMKGPEQPWEFRSKPAWQRLIIMIGGVVVNAILGVMIFWMILMVWGKGYIPMSEFKNGFVFNETMKAQGFKDGDKIVSINGNTVEEYHPGLFIKEIMSNSDASTSFVVNRAGVNTTVDVNEKVIKELASYDRSFAIVPFLPATLDSILPEGNAAKDGLKKGDLILTANGKPIHNFYQFSEYSKDRNDEKLVLSVLRNQDTVTINTYYDKESKIGVAPLNSNALYAPSFKKYGLADALPIAVKDAFGLIGFQIKTFGQMFKGNINPNKSMGGLISIMNQFSATWDWQSFWQLTGSLSMILAFMNILPIPALDGGHVVFLLYEVITGRKPSDKVYEIATIAGFVLIAGLMIYVLGLDITRLWK